MPVSRGVRLPERYPLTSRELGGSLRMSAARPRTQGWYTGALTLRRGGRASLRAGHVDNGRGESCAEAARMVVSAIPAPI